MGRATLPWGPSPAAPSGGLTGEAPMGAALGVAAWVGLEAACLRLDRPPGRGSSDPADGNS
jgi:hypothetical protein